MTAVTQGAARSADTMHMNKHSTPLLDAVRAMHKEEDKRNGVDPYNTGRHRALLLHGPSPDQKLAAELILASHPEELTTCK